MVTSVGKPVESLTFRLLGPLELSRGGDVVKLPASRKVRALLGYLVLASRPVARTQVCELLWDIPNDPRGELRWCLSKIRGLLDTEPQAGDRRRHDASGSISPTARWTRSRSRAHRSTASRSWESTGSANSRLSSRANCSKAWRSRAARCSMPGSPPSGAAFAASRPCCSNTSRVRCRTRAASPVYR